MPDARRKISVDGAATGGRHFKALVAAPPSAEKPARDGVADAP
jgi:hypothetical protein